MTAQHSRTTYTALVNGHIHGSCDSTKANGCGCTWGTAQIKNEYTMEPNSATLICESTEEKDLGVIDPHMNFCRHINTAANTGSKVIIIIKRSFDFLDASTLTKLYSALVRPCSEYAYSVWTPHMRKYIVTLENARRRATKLVP
jgi:hypothetical protein